MMYLFFIKFLDLIFSLVSTLVVNCMLEETVYPSVVVHLMVNVTGNTIYLDFCALCHTESFSFFVTH